MSARARNITTAVLVASAAALGAYVFWIDRDAPTSTELEARRDNLLRVFRREQLEEVRIETPDDRWVLTRTAATDASDEKWMLARGGAAAVPADDAAVERLVHSLEFASPLRKIEPPPEPGTSGLDRPRAVISLRMGKQQARVAIGKEAPSPSGAAYASVDGEGVLVIPRDVAADLLQPADAFRSRTIAPFTMSETAAIALDGAGGARKLVRAPWGGFRLDGDSGPRVNRVAFDSVQQAIGGLRAERFLSDAEADAALAAASGKVTLVLTPKDGAQPVHELELGGECPTASDAGPASPGAARMIVAVRRKPQRLSACVTQTALDALSAPREALLDKHVLDVRPDEIEELLIERSGRKLELLRKGAGWKMRHPEEREVTAADAKGFVQGLIAMEGEVAPAGDFASDGFLQIVQPASGSQTRPQQKLILGTPKGDEVLVRREQDGVVLRLSRNQARLLEGMATFIRSTELLDVSVERLRKVSASWGDDHQEIVRSPNGFKLEAPAGFTADGSLAADLFESVSKLEAERWVADRDDGTFGLDRPRVTAQFEATGEDGGVRVWKLLIGGRAADGAYARWEPDNGVFVLPGRAEDGLTTFAIDRSPFMIDHTEVERMTLKGGGRTVVLTGKAGGELEGEGADRIEDAFLQMRAEAAVKLGDWDEKQPILTIEVKRRPGREERSKDIRIAIGKGDAWRTMNVHYARREGWNATYVIAASRLKPVFEVMGIR